MAISSSKLPHTKHLMDGRVVICTQIVWLQKSMPLGAFLVTLGANQSLYYIACDFRLPSLYGTRSQARKRGRVGTEWALLQHSAQALVWFFQRLLSSFFQLSCMDVTIKKAECQRTDALNCGVSTLESPLDCKEIKPVHPKGNQSWIFIGRTDAEGETPIFWPPDTKNWLTAKDPDTGKDWRQEEKRTNEMVGCHHQLDGHEFEQALGVGDNREAWRAAVHRVTGSQTWLSDNWTELSFLVLFTD